MTSKKRILMITLLGLTSAVAALIIAGMAVSGYQDGDVHFVTALNNFEWATYIAVVAMILSLAGLWLSRRGGGKQSLIAGLLGLLLCLPLVVFIVNFEVAARIYPPINDITTDVEDPPSFWDVPSPVTYPGDHVAELQRKGYPDLKPLELSMDTDQAFKLASEVAHDMDWEIVAENTSELQIEAVARSFLFGFEDYVVIRLQDDNGHTRVDVRSHSRLGRIDRGVNAKRIRAYLRAFKQRVETAEQ